MKKSTENPLEKAYRLTAEDPDTLTQADVLRAIEQGQLASEPNILPSETLEDQDARRMANAFNKRGLLSNFFRRTS